MPLPNIKVDAKSLGIVQTMIGSVIFMFGFVTKYFDEMVSVLSGVMFWGSLCFMICGGLSSASVDYRHPNLVKSSLVMNLVSTVAAVVAVIMYFVDLVRLSKNTGHIAENAAVAFFLGTFRVLLVLSLLEVCMSIWTFVQIYKTKDSTETTS